MLLDDAPDSYQKPGEVADEANSLCWGLGGRDWQWCAVAVGEEAQARDCAVDAGPRWSHGDIQSALVTAQRHVGSVGERPHRQEGRRGDWGRCM